MKKILITISCGVALFFQSCKEVPPVINFGSQHVSDTTYVLSAIPAAQPHNVLIEEFTGEGCSNCPAAHTQLDQLGDANPGRLNVISIYDTSNSPIHLPPEGAAFDLRSADASAITLSTIYTTNQTTSYGNLPGGGVDRVPVSPGTTTWLGASAWSGLISSRLTIADSINLDISSTYASGIATITAKVTYLYRTASLQNLSVAIVEDSIIDYQEKPFGIVDTAYVFKDVLVSYVTPLPFGDPLLDTIATKEAGRFVQRVYNYTVPTAHRKGSVNTSHCRVIAFVHRPSNGNADFQVLQSQQTKLMGP